MTMLQEPSRAHSQATLVARSRDGDRQAFAAIVQDNRSLICSLAYAATGSIARSEDISQEVFIAAWTSLAQLREPAKLRPWLCGIARRLILNARRSAPREQSSADLPDSPDPAPSPSAQAITHEEQALLWRSLSRIPESYRVPLILFYRQEHTILQIAEALDVSEDTVKQRLARGRKLLRAEMETFVESALHRTAPRPAFTASVIAALPAASMHAAPAAISASSTKAALWLKAASVLAAPVLIVTGYWTGYRMGVEEARSDAERKFVRTFYGRIIGMVLAFFVVYVALCVLGAPLMATHPALFTAAVLSMLGLYTLGSVWLTISEVRRRRFLRANASAQASPAAAAPRDYRSPFTLLGLPLVHIRYDATADDKPAVGWIALGDNARGVLLAFGGRATGLVAFGGRAIGCIAVGGAATGIVAYGGFAVGILGIGGFSIGLLAVGGLVLGYDAFGGCTIALHDAAGAIALAHHAALGALAQAPDANTPAAQALLGSSIIFRVGNIIQRWAIPMNLLWVVPLLVMRRKMRRRRLTQKH